MALNIKQTPNNFPIQLGYSKWRGGGGGGGAGGGIVDWIQRCAYL